MSSFTSLNNHFLIAMPSLADPNFSRTVTLICEHSPEGAMGLTINREMDLTLEEVLDQLDLLNGRTPLTERPVFVGGPVQSNRGFVLHQPLGDWESTLAITDELGVSTSRDILDAIARGEGPGTFMLVLGYAGWGPGQLEQEMADNAWLNGPADHRIIFDMPTEQRWQAAAGLLGVDLATLSDQTGHA